MLPVPDPGVVHGVAGPWAGCLRDLEEHGLAIAVSRLDDWYGHLPTGRALTRLLGSDRGRAAELSTPRSRDHFLATRLMVKSLVATALCCDAEAVELAASPRGRMLVRGHPNLHVSLTHTDDAAGVAVSRIGPVGIDLECAARAGSMAGLRRHICTAAEWGEIHDLPADRLGDALLRRWTLKEAYTKALGQGMHFTFTEFGVHGSGPQDWWIARTDGSPADGEIELRSFDVGLGPTGIVDDGRWILALAWAPERSRYRGGRSGTLLNPALLELLRQSH